MFYLVRARLRTETAAELHRALTDGTVAAQQPDGEEIVDSMRRAVVGDDGVVEWSEVCYCPTPLQHERATVYDRFFEDLTTERIEGYGTHTGRPLMAYLTDVVQRPSSRGGPAAAAGGAE